jgi:hypothetical protein
MSFPSSLGTYLKKYFPYLFVPAAFESSSSVPPTGTITSFVYPNTTQLTVAATGYANISSTTTVEMAPAAIAVAATDVAAINLATVTGR